MSDPLLWALHHFVIYYAGQTTQGNKDGVNGANQASGSNHNPKQDTDLPLRADYLSLKRPLQESNILDQSGAPSSGDFQLEVECTESYRQGQNTDQYREFIAGENKYFKSEYLFEDILGKGDSAMVYLATKKYNGMKVAYKSILKKPVEKYAFESNPRPRCHIPSPLVGFEEQSVAQCMSSRPANLLFPHEFALQMYLSRPGRENPYVPTTFDYIALEDEYILVMEHLDEKWSTLSKYVEKKGQLDIEEARNIIKEIVNAMISLKQQGVLHGDLNAGNVMYNTETRQVKLIDFGVSGKLPGWEVGKSVPLKSSDPPSTASEYKAGDDELQKHCYSAHPFAHLVVECEQVIGHRIQSGLLPAIQKITTQIAGSRTRSGCVECIYLTQQWSHKWRSRSEPVVGWTGLWSMNLCERGMIIGYWAARLADFLQVAYWQYQSTLWKYHRDRLVGFG
ncbi:hypothetical protein BASA60_000614 [Batrachochytrium salamandrivorans]|nr:hypothetical protein BASA60_000614 [Batrachochytrium salamandrivorans]